MVDATPFLPGLSPGQGKAVVARFDGGGRLSSEGGLLALREIEHRLGIADRFAAFLNARGQAENHIKAWQNHLAADRTSCHAAEASQFRLFRHAGAYWLLWCMRRIMAKRSTWRVMPFDTLRLRLVKIAARVVELKTQIKIHLPSSAPDQAIFATLLGRLPRLVT